MEKPVVIYGAGERGECAISAIKELGTEYRVIAFCDSNADKIGHEMCGLPIINWQTINNQYNNHNIYIYISPASPTLEEIQKQLLDWHFDEQHILNLSNKRKYKSCSSLENVAIVTNTGIYSCCSLENIRNASPYVTWRDNVEDTVDAFLKQRDLFIEELQNPTASNPCTGCPALCDGLWNADRKISVLALSLSYPCQLACSYCELLSNAKHMSSHSEELDFAKKINITKLVKCFKAKGKFSPSEPIQLSGGEITLAPNLDELLDAVREWPLQIFTNALLYNSALSKLAARQDGSFFNVSLDAGTKETYKIVKGVDAFTCVSNNLRHYARDKAYMLLKYIILPENCHREDLDGFLRLVNEIRPLSVSISCNINVPTQSLGQEIVDAAVYLAKGCRKGNVQFTVLPYFGKENMDYINNALKWA